MEPSLCLDSPLECMKWKIDISGWQLQADFRKWKHTPSWPGRKTEGVGCLIPKGQNGHGVPCTVLPFNEVVVWWITGWKRGPRAWGHLGSGPRCGTGSLGEYKTPGMRQSVWDGLWRPAGAFFQIGLDCAMSHHPVTTQKGSAHSCSNFGGKIQNGVPANSWSLKRIPCRKDLSKLA